MAPNNLTNYHSHCSFCDGKAPMEDFVREALRQGFSSYGISSHAPLPFPTPWTLDGGSVGAYLAETSRLREMYGDRIELYAGMEIDYLDKDSNPASPYFQSLPLDYRIGSVHLLESETGEIVDIDSKPEAFAENLRTHFGGDLRRVVVQYFDKLIRMVDAGGFDIVGHADKMSLNATYCEAGITAQPWYCDKIREYFERIAARGLIVEINTKAWSRASVFFPHRDHFALLRELRIPIVVNSDAHRPELINDGRPEALTALREAGIDEVMQLTRGKWSPTEILQP